MRRAAAVTPSAWKRATNGSSAPFFGPGSRRRADDAVDGLSASLDSSGRLKILAESGKGFDFSKRLNPAPDVDGTFGSGRASLVLGGGEPYALADGQTLDLVGGAGPFTLTFSAGDFADVAQASAAELAAALNADPGLAANGMRAVVVGDRVALQSQGVGAGDAPQQVRIAARGAQPPQPEWGSMLSGARDYFNRAPYLMVIPGVAIAVTVLGFNLLGDAIRTALDPREGSE